MWLILIIILSFLAGFFFALTLIYVAGLCVERDRVPGSIQHPYELTGRRFPVIR